MRQIKFRGKKSGHNGGVFYGLPLYGDLTDNYTDWFILNDIGLHRVHTIEQLVGLDARGKEVYEGDKLTNPEDGSTFTAGMNHILTVKNYELAE